MTIDPGVAVPLTVGVVVTVVLVRGLKIITLGATTVTLTTETVLLPPLLLATALNDTAPALKLRLLQLQLPLAAAVVWQD